MSLKRWSNLRGLTLIEILIALVMTLIVLGAMMYAFRYASKEISRGRAVMEMSNQLLVVEDQLRADFDGVTVDLRPWAKTASPNGYFEYIEGYGSDKSRLDFDQPKGTADQVIDAVRADAIMGDLDDVVAMTVRSKSRPFRGRFNGAIVESNVAEVIWWTTFVDLNANLIPDYNETVTLHRRVLLIRPDLIATLSAPSGPLEMTPGNGFEVQKFFLENDISARPEDIDGDGDLETMIPNSLADLSKRENRFAHLWQEPGTSTFPHQLSFGLLISFSLSEANIQTVDANVVPTLTADVPDIRTRIGDDIIMTDIIAFDLQIFSPDTPVRSAGNLIFEPDDVHWENTLPAQTVETGAFVDLGYRRDAAGDYFLFDPTEPQFSTAPVASPSLALDLRYTDPATPGVPDYVVYDTFSTHYESDGLDNNGDGTADEGTDGIDSDSANGVDDNGEREVLPPYPSRALGIKATIRIVERNTQQARQTEVVSSFVPQ